MKSKMIILCFLLTFLLSNCFFSEKLTAQTLKVLRIDANGSEFISSNGGLTWSTVRESFKNNQKILLVQNEVRYLSTNSGTSWVKIDSEKNSFIKSLSIYPNPSHDILNLEIKNNKAGNYKIVISDITGQLILTENFDLTFLKNNYTMSITSLRPGLYILGIDDGFSNILYKPFIKY